MQLIPNKSESCAIANTNSVHKVGKPRGRDRVSTLKRSNENGEI
ncbi:MAG TPA: hypothetical protein V6C85_37035 [Allocoleopsis sp.]